MEAPQRLNYEIDHTKAGRKIRKHRKARNVQLNDLATELGITDGYLSDLERGKRNWTQKRFSEAHRAISKLANKNKI